MENREQQEEFQPFEHRAWKLFLSSYKPALDTVDCLEALTTDQILQKLNTIAQDDFYEAGTLIYFLAKERFIGINLEATDTYVWLLKSNDLKVLMDPSLAVSFN